MVAWISVAYIGSLFIYDQTVGWLCNETPYRPSPAMSYGL